MQTQQWQTAASMRRCREIQPSAGLLPYHLPARQLPGHRTDTTNYGLLRSLEPAALCRRDHAEVARREAAPWAAPLAIHVHDLSLLSAFTYSAITIACTITSLTSVTEYRSPGANAKYLMFVTDDLL